MSAADKLLGLELKNGWKVTRHLQRGPAATGGMFSQSYIAEKGADVYGVLTLEGSVNSRDHVGGTAPSQVRQAINRAQTEIASR